MTDQLSLFADLPVQEASPFREPDEHFLEPCSRCAGTGTEECPYPRWHPRYILWNPACVKCHGAGKILTHVGPAIDL